MPPKHDGFKDFVLDQLIDMRQVTCRAMFGGYGLYHRTVFFGIIHQERLYIKVTPTTVEQYKAHGMKPFRPNSKQMLRSFYEVPIQIIEDGQQLTEWARASVTL
ncbi:MAG: TfoX/Sxy family protein [Nitrospira sp.]|nr:TfoX/Sxy family protein [Nitrospira sp.]